MANNESIGRKFKSLIDRFRKIYPNVREESPPIDQMEKMLNVIFPKDWREISKYYTGEMLGSYWTLAPDIKGPGDNIVEANLRYRRIFNLPNKYLILNDIEYSAIILETQESSEKFAPVYIIDSIDIENFIHSKHLNVPKREFENYMKFFEYLIDQEEEDRKDEQEMSG